MRFTSLLCALEGESPTRITSFVCTVLLLAAASAFADSATAPPAAQATVRSDPTVLRDFAVTGLTHAKGQARRPFLDVLNRLQRAKLVGITVSTKATKNVQCSGGVCTPTASVAVLNVSELTRLLIDGNVTIATTSQAPDIFINAPFGWRSANGLSLQAIRNITVNRAITDGSAAIDLIYDTTGTGGALSFGPKGNITIQNYSGGLTINGQTYTLVNSIAVLARYIQDNPSGNYALAASYNARLDGKYRQSPIPTTFSGIFQGLGNTISGLHVESSGGNQNAGFFAEVAQGGFLYNLRLTRMIFDVTDADEVGGFVGVNLGTLSGITVTGAVTVDCPQGPASEAGVLAGLNEGTIDNSDATGTITNNNSSCGSDLGGLVGDNSSTGTIIESGADVTVSGSGSYLAGGLAGGNVGSIADSVAIGAAGGAMVGGIVGDNMGTVTSCTADGAVTDSFYGGGLVGMNDQFGSIAGGTAYGAVNASQEAGGLVGYNVGTIDSSIANGAVTSSGDAGGFLGYAYYTSGFASVSNSTSYGTVTGSGYVGGFVGDDEAWENADMYNDGWDMTTSGIADPSRGAGNVLNDYGITGFD